MAFPDLSTASHILPQWLDLLGCYGDNSLVITFHAWFNVITAERTPSNEKDHEMLFNPCKKKTLSEL